ncbi:MAG TPA: hypothetical protein VMV33_08765, partial [Rhodocyclaceae bacterium]|nr:hypothetical protein [Rhodocyclaceae bacterium]
QKGICRFVFQKQQAQRGFHDGHLISNSASSGAGANLARQAAVDAGKKLVVRIFLGLAGPAQGRSNGITKVSIDARLGKTRVDTRCRQRQRVPGPARRCLWGKLVSPLFPCR